MKKMPEMNGLRVVLLLCVVLTLSHSASVPAQKDDEFVEDEYGHYEDYDTYENDNDTVTSATTLDGPNVRTTHITSSTSAPKNFTATATLEMLADSGIVQSATENLLPPAAPFAPLCPAACDCSDAMTFVNCSSRSLTAVPSLLPSTVLHLDLSHNSIEEIPTDAFNNSMEIRQILLNHNHITVIGDQAFAKLQRLDTLNLTANAIGALNKTTFTTTSLSILSLDDNPIVVPETDAFLELPELQHLSLEGCNLTNVYSETFRNLTGLTTLNLRRNSFDENLNVGAFAPLKELQTLKLTSLPQQSVHELCRLLEVIDLINSDSYDISCLELVSGLTFEESTITIAPSKTPSPVHIPPPHIDPTVPSQTELQSSTNTTEQTITERILVTENDTTNAQSQSKPKNNILPIVDATNATQTNDAKASAGSGSTRTEDPPNIVKISSHTLRHILIGIIVVAVAGLAIGIIFRRDVCGIKTKLCRRRRPPPTDQVRPAEQIPLTKI